jgi:hypothetical protein
VITLSAHGRRVQGRHTVDLFWSGSNAANIDIYRNGVVVATVPGLYPEHDLFIQQTKLKNTLRYLMGEAQITHLGIEYYQDA